MARETLQAVGELARETLQQLRAERILFSFYLPPCQRRDEKSVGATGGKLAKGRLVPFRPVLLRQWKLPSWFKGGAVMGVEEMDLALRHHDQLLGRYDQLLERYDQTREAHSTHPPPATLGAPPRSEWAPHGVP